METFERITGKVEVMVFPDNGPEQGDVGYWIKNNGGDYSLFDGCVQQNVKTSTKANWRWTSISIEGIYESAQIGDYIVKDVDGKFRVFNPESFNKNFRPNNEK